MQEDINQKAKEFYPDNMGGLDQASIERYRAGYRKGYKDAISDKPAGSNVWVKGDYDQLYEQVKIGKRTVCYVDYDKDLSIRDICDVDPANMCFGVRGRAYGDPDYYTGMDEKEAFIMICKNINVEWLREFDWSNVSKEQDLADGKELTAYYAEIERKKIKESPNEQPVEQKENDAVEMMKWALYNIKTWYGDLDYVTFHNGENCHTDQLYNEYQKQNNK